MQEELLISCKNCIHKEVCVMHECNNDCETEVAENGCKDFRNYKRTAKWKLGKSGVMYFCSRCSYAAHPREVDEWLYCPICGAKMKGEKDG